MLRNDKMALSLYSPEAHALVRVDGSMMQAIRVQNEVTVADIRVAMRQREDTQRAGYAAALERCYARVRRCVSVGRTSCAFTVPPAVLGLPRYDIERCARFVAAHLGKNGFRVTDGAAPYELHVSWELDERQALEAEDEELSASLMDDAALMMPPTRGGSRNPRTRPSRTTTWFDKTELFASRGQQRNLAPAALPTPTPTTRSTPAFETQTVPRSSSSDKDLGSAFGGLTRMTREEQEQHVAYLQQQRGMIEGSTPTPSMALTTRAVGGGGGRSASPGKFMRSITEFKPSGKFVLRL